jgi:nickel superoxide dismutase
MNILKNIGKLLPEKIAVAHCDIPCGIYDPFLAQRAAHTILRMTQLLIDLKSEDQKKLTHDISRITRVKEEYTDLLEKELETLRNDYFKEEHFKTYLNLESLFTETLKTVSKARQEINLEAANEVLADVLKIAEIFFKTKNVEPVRVASIYPTGGEIVLHK